MALQKPTIAFVLGTRPEAIKLAPVILRAKGASRRFRTLIVSTGQQADLVGPALQSFGIVPDCDLGVMQPRQPLNALLARCLRELGTLLRAERPHAVVVQGDTTTAMAGAMAAFHERIAVAHVEAGLRTGNLAGPFPEEANRQIISRLATMHFAPTVDAKANLLAEGIDAGTIEVTGNTIVDAMHLLLPKLPTVPAAVEPAGGRRIVLVTAHRRENLGKPLRSVCGAIRQLAHERPELCFAFVTHPNPRAAGTAHRMLTGARGVALLPPLPYLETLRLLRDSWLVLTDSGGLQEEAPSFGKPVLVLRDQTERTEGVALGFARLVGTSTARIISEVRTLLVDAAAYDRLTPGQSPYGDGAAAWRILQSLTRHFASPASKSRSTSADRHARSCR
jgi:UDP-N-acetylglucosamine 2-epimerase (non-hydrolysing)